MLNCRFLTCASEKISTALVRDTNTGPRPGLRSFGLNGLDIKLWTNITISNEFAAAAISLYLETEHPLIARFDSNLFVHDLLEGRTKHCSRLLVHALLGEALVCSLANEHICTMLTLSQVRVAHVDHDATKLSLSFFGEAKALWNEQQGSYSPLAIAALQMMIYTGAMHGLDADSLKFSNDCLQIAGRMGLRYEAGSDPSLFNDVVREDAATELRSKAYFAWGHFVSASCVISTSLKH